MPTPCEAVRLLYEDDHLLVVDKPAGLVVHPTYKYPGGTLLDILRQQLDDSPSIVGRLDRLTSGIVVVARDSVAHSALQHAMAGADCHKDYLTVVHGAVTERGAVDLRLRVSEVDRRRVLASSDVGAPSVTHFAPVAVRATDRGSLSLLRCRILTGRRHQIRVHLAARGCPIIGDPVYGDPSRDRAAVDFAEAGGSGARLALHAWRLDITHPYSGERLQVTSPVPADLEPLVRLVATSERDAFSRSSEREASAERQKP